LQATGGDFSIDQQFAVSDWHHLDAGLSRLYFNTPSELSAVKKE
jgi:hypothetical protein